MNATDSILPDVRDYLDGVTNLEAVSEPIPMPEHERRSSMIVLEQLADAGGYRPTLDALLEREPLFDGDGRLRWHLASVLAECDRLVLRDRVDAMCRAKETV